MAGERFNIALQRLFLNDTPPYCNSISNHTSFSFCLSREKYANAGRENLQACTCNSVRETWNKRVEM